MASHDQQREQDRHRHQHDDGGGNLKQLDEELVVEEEDQEVEEVEDQEEEVGTAFHGMNIKRASFREEREFPPPIPLLAQTGNLQSHMPWELRRSYENRRLVIRLVRVKHHEFFRAHRSGGRLRLQLVHFEDFSRRDHPTLHQDNQAHLAGTMDAGPDSAAATGGGAGYEGDEGSCDRVVADHACVGEECGKNVMGMGAGVCSITSSILHTHMPTMRPVHS